MTWNLNSTKNDSSSSSNDTDCSVTLIRWCPSRASVFVTADSYGRWFVFDLLVNPFSPVSSSSSSSSSSSLPGGVISKGVDLSFTKYTGRVAVVVADKKRLLVKVRKLSRDVFKPSSSSSSSSLSSSSLASLLSKEEEALTSSMLSWVGKLSSSSSSAAANDDDDDDRNYRK
jgi:hypothetical protein